MTAIAEDGLAALTMSALAKRLGTSGGHILYYFGSKDRLLLEVLGWSERAHRGAPGAAGRPGRCRTQARPVPGAVSPPRAARSALDAVDRAVGAHGVERAAATGPGRDRPRLAGGPRITPGHGRATGPLRRGPRHRGARLRTPRPARRVEHTCRPRPARSGPGGRAAHGTLGDPAADRTGLNTPATPAHRGRHRPPGAIRAPAAGIRLVRNTAWRGPH